MRFDFQDLRLIVAVAECCSITAGARRAHLSLPAASARIRSLETALDVPLLERRARGVRVTAAGDAFVRHARQLLEQAGRLADEMRDFCLGVTGSLRVRANTAAITEHLPAAIGAFLAAQPAIDLDLEERSSERVVADVASGAADIGIASDAVETAAVATRTFRSDRLVLIVPQGHRLARARQVAFQQLADEHFVGLTQDRALQQLLDSKFAALGRPSRVRVRLASFEGVAQMVGAGAGIAVLPERTAQRLSRRARVRCVGLNDDWTRRRLLVCTPGRTPMSKAASAFLALLGCDPDPPRAERPAPRFSGRPLA